MPPTESSCIEADRHPFVRNPHRTLLSLSLPVLLSLIAEPLTGLVDTAFVARLGAVPLAALGVATVLLSSLFWIFNFLGVGAQTEVARADGAGRHAGARDAAGQALVLAAVLGALLAAVAWPFLGAAVVAMGAQGAMGEGAVVYLRIRLLGGPAILVTVAVFGALRGLQDMRTPLWIAVSINALNVVLDALLIFGAGPIPALGIAGAAWATTASQWLGALWALAAVHRRLGFAGSLRWRDAVTLLTVGRDLFVRTGLLIAFLLLATRAATRMGADAGAAHQAIRQIWVFTALLLDAYAATAQSLVSYFLGATRVLLARRVAGVACVWGLGTGALLTLAMLLGEHWVAVLLVPAGAQGVFAAAWLPAALAQPLNALSFVTDGIHWGTGDYRYLRNAMLIATGLGLLGLFSLPANSPQGLTAVWVVTAGWIAIRCAFGIARVWPGIGRSPLRSTAVVTVEPSAAGGP